MASPIFSNRNRALHMGPFPLERMKRSADGSVQNVPAMWPLDYRRKERPDTVIDALDEYQSMLDALRDGLVSTKQAKCPADPEERARHIKSFAYFQDAPMVGIARMDAAALLDEPIRNAGIGRLAEELKTKQVKSLAAGIETIMADLKDAVEMPSESMNGHTHAIVLLYPFSRDPEPDEGGYLWMQDVQAHRGSVRATETAVVLANYLRVLGYDARAHSGSASDVDLNHLTVAAGLASVEGDTLINPFVQDRFQVAVVTTDFEMTPDQPIAPVAEQPASLTSGLAWAFGYGSSKNALTLDPFAKRPYSSGPHPFETLKRVDTPTTYIDEPRVARVPKRADMFARSKFGDMGKNNQDASQGGYFAQKSPLAQALRRPLGAFLVLQDGPSAPEIDPEARDPKSNADGIKALAYFLGTDAVGISRCPDWVWYSHDANGEPITPEHPNAISFIVDQGFDTTEGSSGDDWIAVV